ncbi:MAG: hypothetical protein COB14_01800 [Alphaproteobacteria bacterium]|nr:MAG: hypothetical protein COB14_01800 [Alphaproteobacteria bacterium]
MRHNTLKLLAFASAVSLGFAMTSNSFAQTETVNATLTLTSAITTVDVSDMDFGEWVAIIPAGGADDTSNDVIITLTSDGTVASSVAGVTDSTVLQVTAPLTEGVVTVETPSASSLTITRSGDSDFADAGISLNTTSYRTASEGPISLDANTDTGTVTVVGAATAETVTFGGTITFAEQAADGVHPASFDVTFSY